MPEFNDISAKDKVRYDAYRQKDLTNASEGAFTTLFIWNNYYNLQTAENGEFFFIRFNIKNKEPSYLFPIGSGDIKKAVAELFEYSCSRGEKLRFTLLNEKDKQRLEASGFDFEYTETPNCSDYVYLTEKMISLSGKKLHSKRNHLNYFFENYNYEYKRVTTKDELEECAQRAYSLVSAKEKNKNPFELGAMKAYFDNYFDFGQQGAFIRVDGEIAAMSFGEPLDDKTALIQIELASDNIRGAYQAINKLFCEDCWKDFEYVNREEDMGIEGLRKAKQSYHPAFMADKFTALCISPQIQVRLKRVEHCMVFEG